MTENNPNSKHIDTCIVPQCALKMKKRTEHFQGGRITDIQFLNLEKAAVMASRHAGTEITPDDFLISAGLGEIEIIMLLRRSAKMLPISRGDAKATAIQYQPHDCIPIPFSACRDFVNFGFATWNVRYELNMEKSYQRYIATHALHPSEPDFEVVEADCRVNGHWIHALADNFLKQATPTPQQNSEPVPIVKDGASSSHVVPYKKAALKSAHIHEWPTIESDIKYAAKNGLAAAAKYGKRGWLKDAALHWARANGKLISAKKSPDSLTQAMHKMSTLPSKTHTIKG